MSLAEFINQVVDNRCTTRRCSQGSCSVVMPKRRHQDWALIDMDSPNAPIGQHARRCDYIFFGRIEDEEEWVIPIELKEGSADISEVSPQLQAGSDVANSMLTSKVGFRFLPILASGRLDKLEKIELKKERNKVRFRNAQIIITRIKCHTSIVDASKYPELQLLS